jgi:cobalt-zinc-cadmium efflux system protein
MPHARDHHDHDAAGHAGHDHGRAGHSHAGHALGTASERRTAIAAAITLGFMVVEAVGGVLSGSLALLADAAHMLTDAGSLALAWWAFRQARRPASPRMSYGHHRMPVLVAFANGVVLLMVTAWIVVEAMERLANPVAVEWPLMAGVAAAGLAANIAAFAVLARGERNLNIRGALLHVASDMLGSVGALAAAAVIALTGWMPADPILSLIVAALLLRATLSLVRESAHILLEGAPEGTEGPAIAADLVASVPGVVDVHHVHVWSLAEGRVHATMHAVAAEGADPGELVRALKARLAEAHAVGHATIEVEAPERCADRPAAAAGG